MRLAAVELDLDAAVVHRDGAATELRPAEAALLRYLADRPGQNVPRDELLSAVWGYAPGVRSRTLDTTVKTLRKKIEADPARPDHLRTVHGVGYCFDGGGSPSTIAVPLGRLFGRDALLASVLARVGEERLLTLVGPGGIGKTRLALELAARSAPAVVVTLERAVDGDDVLAEVARALDVPLSPREPGSTLGRALAARGPLLVVLDNAERLDPSGATAIATLAEAAPRARLLITSRRALRLRAEVRVEVPPLDPEAAAALLVDRGRRVRASFGAPAESAAVDALARELEGIPLALELAAARAGVLGAAELLDRIRGSIGWLSKGAADAPDRHQTLANTIGWTWEALSEPQRVALSQLAAFPAGFDADGAERVLRLPDGLGAVDAVEALRDWSLLVERPRAGRVGFALLAAVRAYVRERRPPDAATRERHRGFAAERGRAEARAVDRGGGAAALGRLVALLPDLVEAIRSDEGSTGALIAADRALVQTGGFRERVGLADRAVASATRAADVAVARAIRARARQDTGGAGADDDLDAALAAGLEAADPEVDALVLALLCDVRLKQGRIEESAAAARQALPLHRAAGDASAEGERLANLGLCHLRARRWDAALEAFGPARALLERAGNLTAGAKVLGFEGELHELMGELDEAGRCFARALERHQAMGYRPGVVRMQGNLGLVAGGRGDFDRSAEAFRAAVDEAVRLGDLVVERLGLLALSRADLFRGRPRDALESAQRAVVLLPDRDDPYVPNTWGTLGAAQAGCGQLAAAHRAYDRAEACLNPDDQRLRLRLDLERALLYAGSGALEAADQRLERAASAEAPDDPEGARLVALGRGLCERLRPSPRAEVLAGAAEAARSPRSDLGWALARRYGVRG